MRTQCPQFVLKFERKIIFSFFYIFRNFYYYFYCFHFFHPHHIFERKNWITIVIFMIFNENEVESNWKKHNNVNIFHIKSINFPKVVSKNFACSRVQYREIFRNSTHFYPPPRPNPTIPYPLYPLEFQTHFLDNTNGIKFTVYFPHPSTLQIS